MTNTVTGHHHGRRWVELRFGFKRITSDELSTDGQPVPRRAFLHHQGERRSQMRTTSGSSGSGGLCLPIARYASSLGSYPVNFRKDIGGLRFRASWNKTGEDPVGPQLDIEGTMSQSTSRSRYHDSKLESIATRKRIYRNNLNQGRGMTAPVAKQRVNGRPAAWLDRSDIGASC
jgi:hypothetical protein